MDSQDNKPSGPQKPAAHPDDLFPHDLQLNMDVIQGTGPADPQGRRAEPPPNPSARDDPFHQHPATLWRRHLFKHVTLPVWLTLAGWGGYSALAWWKDQPAGQPPQFDWNAFYVMQEHLGAFLLINILLMTLLAMLTAPLAGVSTGRLGAAFLRLVAAAVFPWAVAQLVPAVDPPALHAVVGGAVQALLTWVLLTWLFEIDLMEGFLWTIYVEVVQISAGLLLVWLGLSLEYQLKH